MKQFLISRSLEPGETMELTGADFHYLARVRRILSGHELICRSSNGRLARCLVNRIEDSRITIFCIGIVDSPLDFLQPEGKKEQVYFHLIQCLPKGKKLDLIVRQAVELGVHRISLIQSRHAIPDLTEKWERKSQHLEGIIREAFQQSGATGTACLDRPLSFKDFITSNPLESGHLGLFFHERELEKYSLHEYLMNIPSVVRLIVGPEGGLAPEEVTLLEGAGYCPAFLGPQTLRCETAAGVALGVVSLLIREHSFWLVKDRESHD